MTMNSEGNQSFSEAQAADSDALEKTQTANEKLHYAPLPKIHYLIATAVGLFGPILVIYLYNLPYNLFSVFLFFLTMLLSIVYLFHIFKVMLATRFNFHEINLPTNALIASLSLYAMSALLALSLLNRSSLDIDFATATIFEKALYYASLAGFFGMSGSLIIISFQLENLSDNLYHLLKPLRFLMLLLSLILFIETMAFITFYVAQAPLIIALSILILSTADILVLLVFGLNCLLLGLIFLLAFYHDWRQQPTQPTDKRLQS
jgi:hypothetical protein